MTEPLAAARAALVEAELAERPADRFLGAHLAALRVAAVVLAARATPARRSSPVLSDVWQLLTERAPEFAEWAGFFAAFTWKRRAVAAGATALVSLREADDLIRDARLFCDDVARRLSRSAGRVAAGPAPAVDGDGGAARAG